MSYEKIVRQLFPDGRLTSTRRLTGGVSADVFRLEVESEDGESQAVVLRIHGNSYGGHPADLEYRLLQTLHAGGLPVPEPMLVDSGGAVLEDPYLVMSFVPGDTEIPDDAKENYIAQMASMLARIHAHPTAGLEDLPVRHNPLPEVFDFLPEEDEWQPLVEYLGSLNATAYTGSDALLHGDFWPENLLWEEGALAAVLDWEDAARGDPLSDLAAARVELRYKFGVPGMQHFTECYRTYSVIDDRRLALWQIYVSAAACRYMGDWGLPAAREAHMRRVALASIREAGAELMGER